MFKKMYREDALREQKFECLYCNNRETFKTVTAEHKKCRVNGGSNNKENIAATCERCNKAKGYLNHDKFNRIVKSKDMPDDVRYMSSWFARRLNDRIKKMKQNLERVCR